MKIKYSKLIIFTLSLIILDELPIGFTEQEWEKSQERMQRRNDEFSSREIINTSFPRKLNADDFIVSNGKNISSCEKT